jgi:1-deoxy-D-xylulose-5-phosphate reductoisomerase
MKKKIVILGSTGSIGKITFNIIKKNQKDFKIILLTTNKNINIILKQARQLKVKNILISSVPHYLKLKNRLKNNKIKIHNNLNNLQYIIKKRVDYTMCAISGLSGLKPTIDAIKFSKTIAIANKESIICGWQFIDKALQKNKTKFIPIDSEHFSIWTLLKNQNIENVKRIYLTASGGPFLNKKKSLIANIKPKYALKHPNWKMGKKISIDSSTLMNKIFEVIEAKKIFNLDISKFKIIIHPKSYVHAIVHFKNGLVKFLAHDTNMAVPIMNSLYINKSFIYNDGNLKFELLNDLNFKDPDIEKFPVVKLLNKVKNTPSYFETILIAINDTLVDKYLSGEINYLSLNDNLLKLIKTPYFTRYYKLKPKNIIDIKIMVRKVITYLNKIKLN